MKKPPTVEKRAEKQNFVNFTEFGEAKSFIYISLLFSAISGIFITKWRGRKGKGLGGKGHLIHYKI